MSKANKALVERWNEEIFNSGNLASVDELVADDYVFHGVHPEPTGRAGLKQAVGAFRRTFPDGHFTHIELIAEGDKVAQRWSFKGTQSGPWNGVEVTGKPVAFTGTTVLRIAGGKVAESWVHLDVLGWLAQIGRSIA